MSDKEQLAKFEACQNKMKQLLTKPPTGIQNWNYQESVKFKKAAKECERFLKLKPSDDLKLFHRIDNQLSKLNHFYSGLI